MKLLNFKVRLSVNVLNLRRPLSIVIRSTSLFGVGGSGRSPVSPPTPRPRGSAWGWACYPGDRKLSVREVQYRGVETVTTTGGWGAQRVPMGPTGGALGRLAPVGRRKSKSKVFLKENIGFCRSRVLPSGSREGGLGVPGTTSGRRRAPSVCSEDDFGSSGDDLGQL